MIKQIDWKEFIKQYMKRIEKAKRKNSLKLINSKQK